MKKTNTNNSAKVTANTKNKKASNATKGEAMTEKMFSADEVKEIVKQVKEEQTKNIIAEILKMELSKDVTVKTVSAVIYKSLF
jgi:hypothetical protein